MISFLGYASGLAASSNGCGLAPIFLQQNPKTLSNIHYNWHKVFTPSTILEDNYDIIAEICTELAISAYSLAKMNKKFITIGGDHSCAIGTWSGVAEAVKKDGELGLIWIDAHMDAHTPDTTKSGNIHGMPLAVLLGYGDKRLTRILSFGAKINPKNICLIGTRSYEKGEANLLKMLGVRIYYMEEVREKGIRRVLEEAIKLVTENTVAYGISLDLDVFDPVYISGTGCHVEGGLDPQTLINSLSLFHKIMPIAFEIAEYDPSYDKNLQTARTLSQLLENIMKFHV